MLHIYIVFFIIGSSLVQVCLRPSHDPYTDLAYGRIVQWTGEGVVGKHHWEMLGAPNNIVGAPSNFYE